MIVVAETTPLHYLALIEQTHLLPALYGCVLIPPAVMAELNDPETPELVSRGVGNRPHWLEVRAPGQMPLDFPEAPTYGGPRLLPVLQIGLDFITEQ